MKAWRRTSRSGNTAAAATCHRVLSVHYDGTHTVWTFDAAVDTIDDDTLFQIAGVGPNVNDGASGSTVLLKYLAGDTGGLPWTLGDGALSFIDTLPACSGQSGFVT